MRKGFFGRYFRIVLVAVFIVLGGAGSVLAETLVSPNYQMTETQFGTGAEFQGCSEQYCARVSIGDIADGEPARMGEVEFEEDVGTEPVIEVIIEPGQSNLGVLSTEETATKTTLVKIRNHLTGGYTMQIMGDPPKYDGHTLQTPSIPTASMPGNEQFAINLAKNTIPVVGADPIHKPNGLPVVGEVDQRYSMSDLFMYKSGDTIAQSSADSGRTDYTISMIVNISNSTPAGHYAGDFFIMVVPAY